VSLLKTALGELLGLFMDDRRLAGAILVWLLAAYFLLPRLGLSSSVAAIVLPLGLAAILLGSALIQARAPRL
jgi:hypothetical protein